MKKLGLKRKDYLNDSSVIKEIENPQEGDMIFPSEINFKDFNSLFDDDGDWYSSLMWNKENGFNSTIDIAMDLKNQGIEVEYPPELIEETKTIELEAIIGDDGENNITLELISPDDYYNKSYYFYSETLTHGTNNIGNRYLRNSITEDIMKIFRRIYCDREIKAKFKIRNIVIEQGEEWSDESLENLVARINGGLYTLWIQNSED